MSGASRRNLTVVETGGWGPPYIKRIPRSESEPSPLREKSLLLVMLTRSVESGQMDAREPKSSSE